MGAFFLLPMNMACPTLKNQKTIIEPALLLGPPDGAHCDWKLACWGPVVKAGCCC